MRSEVKLPGIIANNPIRPHKKASNLKTHHSSFQELATIFENTLLPPITDIPDIKHSKDENKYLAYGWTASGFYAKVWYTYRDGVIRIVGGMKVK